VRIRRTLARTSRKSNTLRSATLAIVCLTAAAALYALAVGTSGGRELEASIVALELDGAPRRAAVWAGLMTNALTVALATAALFLVVARSAGAIDAVLVALIPCGAVLLTAGLKIVLPMVDAVHGESQRALGAGFFPSGHAAAGASLCLAALVGSRPRLRTRAPAIAAACTTALAVPHFLTAWHHVVDVIGAILLTTAWTSLLMPWLGGAPSAPLDQPAASWWWLLLLPGTLLALAALTGSLLILAAAVTSAVASCCAYGVYRVMGPAAESLASPWARRGFRNVR